MNVSDMISTIRTLGIGEVYEDDESKRIALLFLNLANDQLYSETANVNDDIYVKETIVSTPGQSYITLANRPFIISTVYSSGCSIPLCGLDVYSFDKYQVENTISADPKVYNNTGNIINISPIVSSTAYTISVRHAPVRSILQENTSEDQIPYPPEYHRVLVDGALYYLFQDESGFKNTTRENNSSKRWDDGRSDLKSYLFGKNKKLISTYQGL